MFEQLLEQHWTINTVLHNDQVNLAYPISRKINGTCYSEWITCTPKALAICYYCPLWGKRCFNFLDLYCHQWSNKEIFGSQWWWFIISEVFQKNGDSRNSMFQFGNPWQLQARLLCLQQFWTLVITTSNSWVIISIPWHMHCSRKRYKRSVLNVKRRSLSRVRPVTLTLQEQHALSALSFLLEDQDSQGSTSVGKADKYLAETSLNREDNYLQWW